MTPFLPLSPTPAPPPSKAAQGTHDAALMDAARELEANFLSEMLKSAGLGESPTAFGGGVGEDQFASFLRLEQARAMVQSGGIGLAQSLFEAMKDIDDGAV